MAYYWSNMTSHSMEEAWLIEQINFQVDNIDIYIQVGNRTFRQTIGIPMGTDCAPPLLFHYEYKFMLNSLRQDRQLSKCFSNTFRYIDDLLTLNTPTFEESIRNIYPPHLEFKRTTEKKE